MSKKNKISKFSIILLLILLIPLIFYYDKLHMNLYLKITALRGISNPSCFWVNKIARHNTYQKLYFYYGDFPIFYFSNVKYIIPTDITYIKQILELTPTIFKQKSYTYDFFKKFIGYNVDTVTGSPWKSQRVLNEKVLIINYLKQYANYYNTTIQTILKQSLPQNYKEFKKVSKKIISKIIFNKETIPSNIYSFLIQSKKIHSVINNTLSEESANPIRVFLLNELHFSKSLSLLSLCKDTHLTKDELIEKIPHWIFPIASLIHTNVPRILTYIINHNFEKLRRELQSIDLTDINAIYGARYLRKCILETLRLNCPMSSTIRILTKPFTYNKGKTFYKNSLFILLNYCVLHDNRCFDQPECFIPERWTEKMEMMYSSLIFNQGPHHCPWKHIAIFLMSSFIAHYLKQSGALDNKNTIASKKSYDSIHPKKLVFSFKSVRNN